MKIGIVDLDTSHPQHWIPILRSLGHEVVGVWDGGDVHPQGYAEEFARTHAVPQVFDRMEAAVDAVDGVILHGCDWDLHVSKARPFVEAGKAVLVDKPMAGRPRDLEQLLAWGDSGARVYGGSSLRFCLEARQWLALPVEERGTPHTVFAGCGVDEFNYGIHGYALLSAFMGAGIQSVRHVDGRGQRRVEVEWRDGCIGILAVGAAAQWLPFHASVVTEKAVFQCQPDSAQLYRALLEAVIPYLSGECETPPLPLRTLLEPEWCALAARKSWMENNRRVTIAELAGNTDGYDGAAFAQSYRKSRYGG